MSQDVTDTTPTEGVKRREFLKVLGATSAAATVVGCSSDKVEKLIPYVVSPDNTVPGVSTYYATTCRECGAGCGLLVETRDGRAIKAEGNPEHPVNHGALCARGQAGLQGLYNPDRFRTPMIREGGKLVATTWDKAIAALQGKLADAKKNGAKDAVFINQHEQGSFPAFLDSWLAGSGMPGAISSARCHRRQQGRVQHQLAEARLPGRQARRLVRRGLPRWMGNGRHHAGRLRRSARQARRWPARHLRGRPSLAHGSQQ